MLSKRYQFNIPVGLYSRSTVKLIPAPARILSTTSDLQKVDELSAIDKESDYLGSFDHEMVDSNVGDDMV